MLAAGLQQLNVISKMVVKYKEKIARACTDLLTFIFNKKTKEFLGRTWQSWTKIAGFFLTLYAVLAAIFAAHLGVFLSLTPRAGLDARPWNFGQYAYPNYPNSKIALVANPQAFSYSRSNREATLSATDNRFISELISSANASGVNSECLNTDTQYGYTSGLPCVFIHVLRVYTWVPENFTNQTLDTMLLNCSFRSTELDLNITTSRNGIPLNISNEESRSFPYRAQTDYITPVMAVRLNLTGVPTQNPTGAFIGTLTCSVDLEGMGLSTPTAENLLRQFEIPADSTTTITFN